MSPRFDSPPPPGDSTGHPDVGDDSLFAKPRPRPARSSAETREIRTRNRRREYLERNPGYFKLTLSYTDPILYDSLIRRFQTPAEREAESKEKGYARVLEGSLLRGEEKLARLAAATTTTTTTTETGGSSGTEGGEEEASTSTGIEGEMEWQGETTTTTTTTVTQAPVQTMPTLDKPTPASTTTTTTTSTMFATFTAPAQQPLPRFGGLSFGEPSPSSSSPTTSQTMRRPPAPPTASATETTKNLAALALTGTETPAQTREQGQEQWHSFLRERFVRGGDEDFDYAGLVDNDDELDTLERREEEEAWFDEEEPDWASDGDGEEGRKVERVLEGETGVQDF